MRSSRRRRFRDPIRRFDCCPATDGAAALVLTSEALAKHYGSPSVRVAASVMVNGPVRIGDYREITIHDGTVNAARRAYEHAGVGPRDIDVAELHDCFSIAEIVDSEDLGFFDKGEGGPNVRDRRARPRSRSIQVGGCFRRDIRPARLAAARSTRSRCNCAAGIRTKFRARVLASPTMAEARLRLSPFTFWKQRDEKHGGYRAEPHRDPCRPTIRCRWRLRPAPGRARRRQTRARPLSGRRAAADQRAGIRDRRTRNVIQFARETP